MKIKVVSVLSLLAMTVISVGCGETPKPVPVLTAVAFEEYQLPGRIPQVKEMGFNSCSAGGDYFECVKTEGVALLGVHADSARIVLQYRDNFKVGSYSSDIPEEQRTDDKLTYGEISFKFRRTQYNKRCVDKLRKTAWDSPIECRKADSGVDYLKYLLGTKGWLETSSKSHRYYYHPNELVSIHIDRNGAIVDLRRIPLSERNAEVVSIQRRIEETRASQAAQDSVLKKLNH